MIMAVVFGFDAASIGKRLIRAAERVGSIA